MGIVSHIGIHATIQLPVLAKVQRHVQIYSLEDKGQWLPWQQNTFSVLLEAVEDAFLCICPRMTRSLHLQMSIMKTVILEDIYTP